MKYLIPLLLMAGCAALDPNARFTNDTCRAVMLADPAVQRTYTLINNSGVGQEDQDVAKAKSYDRCMIERGFQRGGGVQRVRPAF